MSKYTYEDADLINKSFVENCRFFDYKNSQTDKGYI